MAVTKKRKAILEKVDFNRSYTAVEAISLAKECATSKFNETVEAAIRLGVDPRKSDQNVRGSCQLPHGTGKTVRVAVFTQGDKVQDAEKAGADAVGMDDLAEQVQKGDFNYDVVIASPDAMKVVGKLGPVLGPRGLMPNPKDGTVSVDIANAVKNAKGGQVRFRVDKAGIVHALIGKADFEPNKLKENLEALLTDLVKAKPASAKGTYLKKVSISTTMGPGLAVDVSSLSY